MTNDEIFENYSSDEEDNSFLAPESFKGRDELIPNDNLEIEVQGGWVPANFALWRSWTGRRRIWNMEYHGPVYAIGGKDGVPYTGRRICSCDKCQSYVESNHRYN